MTRRLAAICLITMLGTGVGFPSPRAQHADASLKGIDAVYVAIEPLPDGATVLGLTEEAIQTDVELKLRLAGLRVVTQSEWLQLPGQPYLYVKINVSTGSQAANVDVELCQNVLLKRNNSPAFGVATWRVGGVISGPDAQFIRERTKDLVDKFLNAWLSVNPKK
jgi:hypothetical protein